MTNIFEKLKQIRDDVFNQQRYALSIAIAMTAAVAVESEAIFLKGKLKGGCSGALINASFANGELRKRIIQNYPELQEDSIRRYENYVDILEILSSMDEEQTKIWMKKAKKIKI